MKKNNLDITSGDFNKPRRWFLYGMYGTINVGDEAVAYSVVKGLDSIFGKGHYIINVDDVELFNTFLELEPESTAYFEGRPFCLKFWKNWFRYIFVFSKVDTVIVGGGGLLHDTFTWRSAAVAVMVTALGRLWNKTTFITGVGVGPLKRWWLRKLLSLMLPYVDYVTVRDQSSLRLLQEICDCNSNQQATADVVCSLDLSDYKISSEQRNSSLICIAFRGWPGLEKKDFAKFLDCLALKGYQIQLQCFEVKYDPAFYKQVLSDCQQETRGAVELFIPTKFHEVLSSMAKAKCVFSMRLHGCILAVQLGTPLIPVAYGPKVRGFIEQIGMTDFLYEVDQINEDLSMQTEDLISRWQNKERNVLEKFREVQTESRKNFSLIYDYIHQKQITRLSLGGRLRLLFCVVFILGLGFLDSVYHLLLRIIRKCKRNK